MTGSVLNINETSKQTARFIDLCELKGSQTAPHAHSSAEKYIIVLDL